MTRALALLALAACNPVAYVPTLVPAAPPTAGVRAGLGVNAFGAQGTAELTASPVDGLAFFGRGLYGNTLGGHENGEFTQRGGDLGVLLAQPISRRLTLDLGASVGRATVTDSYVSFDSSTPGRTRTSVRLTSAHLGLFIGDNPPGEGNFRIGPAVRLARVVALESDGGSRSGSSLFVEPAVRATFTTGPVNVQAQGGLSLPAAGNLADDYTSVPVFGGVSAAVRL